MQKIPTKYGLFKRFKKIFYPSRQHSKVYLIGHYNESEDNNDFEADDGAIDEDEIHFINDKNEWEADNNVYNNDILQCCKLFAAAFTKSMAGEQYDFLPPLPYPKEPEFHQKKEIFEKFEKIRKTEVQKMSSKVQKAYEMMLQEEKQYEKQISICKESYSVKFF